MVWLFWEGLDVKALGCKKGKERQKEQKFFFAFFAPFCLFCSPCLRQQTHQWEKTK